MHAKYVGAMQKSKINCLNEGDSNSRFFYAKMSMRRYIYNIKLLYSGKGELVFDAVQIQDRAIQHYTNLFNREQLENNHFQNIQCRKVVNDLGKHYLLLSMLEKEVHDVVFSIKDEKSPGPDGFSSKFYKLH